MLPGTRSLLGESWHRNAKGDNEKEHFHGYSPGASAARDCQAAGAALR
jgi:hypothetical protein